MVLSKVTLDLEDTKARRDLADPYEMHATLMRLVDGGVSRPLWRLEVPREARPPYILVQTSEAPDPPQLRAGGATYFTSFEIRPHLLALDLREGELLRFRLRANPTVTRQRKRHGLVREEEQLEWICRVLSNGGATEILATVTESGRHVMRRRRAGARIVVQGATYDGVLRVSDVDRLRRMLVEGVGHAKALGFGLLTVAR
jgi:CRISPR system Cascade subunit CasE